MRLRQARWKPRKSKEGYQTLDRERRAAYATQPEVALRLMEQNAKRAMCDTDMLSPPRLSQRTWLHYFMSLAGNQQCCLIPSKTTLWIINARSQNKKRHIINVFGASFKRGSCRCHSAPFALGLWAGSCKSIYVQNVIQWEMCFKQNNDEILRNNKRELMRWKPFLSSSTWLLEIRVRSWDSIFYLYPT